MKQCITVKQLEECDTMQTLLHTTNTGRMNDNHEQSLRKVKFFVFKHYVQDCTLHYVQDHTLHYVQDHRLHYVQDHTLHYVQDHRLH